MFELNTILKEIGNLSLDALWFPLLVWSICAVCVYAILKLFSNSNALYQYHTRVALVAGIPLGIFASVSIPSVAGLFSTSASPDQLSFLVIQNPITVTARSDTAAASVNWADPYLWLGLITALLAVVALVQIVRLFRNYLHLAGFAKKLPVTRLGTFENLHPDNQKTYDSIEQKTYLAFSEEVEIPFTFGWRRPVIFIPSFLKPDPEKVNLAIRHELMHIKRADYLVNGFIMAVKSLFWFHPLLHLFDREISCDSEVLADKTVSRKKYAQLLFDLAPVGEFRNRPVVSMSVNQSTLKKRIHTMKTLTQSNRPMMKSILFSLILLVGLSGFIACSDLETTGVTNKDLQQVQANMEGTSAENQPLIVLKQDLFTGVDDQEGEILSNAKLARIKHKYIKSINVLKGRRATEAYGEQGRNGVIELALLDKEKALSDLKPVNSINDSSKPVKEFFVVVEEMPELIGGLASLQKEIKYPEEAREAGIEGRVIVQFIVNEQGEVENPQVIRGIGGGCDEEALRAVKQAKFEPGRQKGEPVRVQYSLPIVYRL